MRIGCRALSSPGLQRRSSSSSSYALPATRLAGGPSPRLTSWTPSSSSLQSQAGLRAYPVSTSILDFTPAVLVHPGAAARASSGPAHELVSSGGDSSTWIGRIDDDWRRHPLQPSARDTSLASLPLKQPPPAVPLLDKLDMALLPKSTRRSHRGPAAFGRHPRPLFGHEFELRSADMGQHHDEPPPSPPPPPERAASLRARRTTPPDGLSSSETNVDAQLERFFRQADEHLASSIRRGGAAWSPSSPLASLLTTPSSRSPPLLVAPPPRTEPPGPPAGYIVPDVWELDDVAPSDPLAGDFLLRLTATLSPPAPLPSGDPPATATPSSSNARRPAIASSLQSPLVAAPPYGGPLSFSSSLAPSPPPADGPLTSLPPHSHQPDPLPDFVVDHQQSADLADRPLVLDPPATAAAALASEPAAAVDFGPDVSLREHTVLAGHARFYSYRVTMANLRPSYAGQYAHALSFWARFPRADLRSTFGSHRAFARPHVEFAEDVSRALAALKGWLAPGHPALEKSLGYRKWRAAVDWRERKLEEDRQARAFALEDRLTKTVERAFRLETAQFDLLSSGRRATDSSPWVLADKLGVTLVCRPRTSDAFRVLLARGPHYAVTEFGEALDRLAVRIKSQSVDLPVRESWTAADVVRDVLAPHFRAWQRSLGAHVDLDRLHVGLRAVSRSVCEVTVSSIHEELLPLAVGAVAHHLDLPPQNTPLYVMQPSVKTPPDVCALSAEPDGRRRIRARPAERETYADIGRAGDLTCGTVLVPLSSSSAGRPAADGVYRPELQDALELGSVEADRSQVARRSARKAPAVVRIEARIVKFLFPATREPADGRAPVSDLAAKLPKERSVLPQTGQAVKRLKKSWLAGQRVLAHELFHRVTYVERSRLALPTARRALAFEWEQDRVVRPGRALADRPRAWRDRFEQMRGTGAVRATKVELRTVNVLFPRRNFDAVITKSSSTALPTKAIPRRLRRAFTLRGLRGPMDTEVQSRPAKAMPKSLRCSNGKRHQLAANETVHRTVYLVEDASEPAVDPAAGVGRKVVVETVECYLTGAVSEYITIVADDPRTHGAHPDAYLPEDMLRDVNHMVCMEDQAWSSGTQEEGEGSGLARTGRA